MSDSILDNIGSRTKVKRDTSVNAVPSTPKPSVELNKRTVRISDEAIAFFGDLKVKKRVSVDCLLEALVLYCQSHPEAMDAMVESAKAIGKARQDKANRDRARTMSKNFL